MISHAVARERTKPRRENDELLYYSIQRFFDDSFISTILFLSLSLLFYFSPCFHRILPYFSLYPLRLIILFFHLMTEHTYTQIAYTQIRTQWIACEWLENAEREINRLQSRYFWRESLSVLSLLLGFACYRRKTGKIRYVFLLERFSRIVFVFNNVFYSAIFKKENYLNAHICIYLMYSFFLSIRRVDTACKRLRKKRGKFWKKAKERDRSLWPKIIFSLSRLVEATFIRSSSVFLYTNNFHRKIVFLIFYRILFTVVRKKKRKIRLWAKYLTFFSIPSFFIYIYIYIYISLLFLLICPPFSFSLSSHSSSFTFNSFINCKNKNICESWKEKAERTWRRERLEAIWEELKEFCDVRGTNRRP